MNNKAKHPMYRPALLRMVRRDLFELAICIALAALFVLLSSGAAFAQGNVGINNATPHAKSLLDLTSNDKGLLAPRMTAVQRIAMFPAPDATAKGMLVYQTDGAQGFYYYDGAAWVMVQNGGAGWSLTGNAGTNPATNLLGTTDAQPLLIGTSGTERMRIASNGNVAIGAAIDPMNYRLVVENASAYHGVLLRNTNPASWSGLTNMNDQGGSSVVGIGNSGCGPLANMGYAGTNTAHPFALLTSGVERMRIAPDGNVGIGKTAISPNHRLQVEGTNVWPPLQVRTTNTAGYSGAHFLNDLSNAQTHIGIGNSAAPTFTNLGYAGTTTNHAFVLTTNDLERVRIAPDGNVGIGTPTPGRKLDVLDAGAGLVARFKGSNPAGYSVLHIMRSDDVGAHLGFFNPGLGGALAGNFVMGSFGNAPVSLTTNNAERMHIATNGNVGIGMTPFFNLDLHADAQAVARFNSGNAVNGTVIELKNSTAGGNTFGAVNFNNAANSYAGQLAYHAAEGMTFRSGGIERMRLSPAGCLGLGMAPLYNIDMLAPQSVIRMNTELNPNGSVIELKNSLAGNNTFGAINFNDGTNTYAGQLAYHSTDGMTVRSGSFERMRVAPGGNVGIGTAAPASLLHVSRGAAGFAPNASSALTVEHSGNAYASILTASGETGLLFGGAGAAEHGGIVYQNAGGMSLRTGGNVERIRVAASGNVGIGTATPTTKLEVNGFTKLGTDAPAIKVKKLTGTTAATEGGTVAIAHGLTVGKIIGVQVLVEYGAGNWIPTGYTINPEYQVDYVVGVTNITLYNQNTNSGNVLSKPVKILITYEE